MEGRGEGLACGPVLAMIVLALIIWKLTEEEKDDE
jgi:hypothetical protein